MTMNGDAADDVVRMMINGTEMAVRLTGSAAKNLAAILVAWSKKEKKVYGKTTMMKLLKSGEPLQVLPMTREQYSRFKSMARRKVLYAPFLNTKVKDDKVDVVISEKSLPMVNYILKSIGYGKVEEKQAEDIDSEIKKKDTQSRQSSEDARASSEARRDTQAPKSRDNKASVREQLEQNRKQLLKKEQRHSQKARSKKRPKSKER